MRKIVCDLKDYSHMSTAEWHWADLRGARVRNNMARNQLKYHCGDPGAYGDLPQVYCLGSQLNQVFANLIVNRPGHREQGRDHHPHRPYG